MLCPLDGQFVTGIVVDDLRDVVKGWTMLAQDKLLVFCLQKLHVQEALTALEGEGEGIMAALTVPHQVTGFLAKSQ